jgi:hypothetical protein
LQATRGIEVGHIFQLGRKYSTALEACFTSEAGQVEPLWMGCYGIGVSRLAQAAVEQHHDADGIRWPVPIAPFEVIVVIANLQDQNQCALAETLYLQLQAAGLDVLLDDRPERAGVKFKDADLIGIPWRIVVGRGAAEGVVELVDRSGGSKPQELAAADVVPEFGSNGKDVVTVRHLLTHTGGFPHAPMGPPDWFTSEGRRRRFERWSLRWEPGTRYEYHATAAHWVLAEIVETVTGRDHRQFFAEEVARPLGIALTLGVPEGQQDNVRRLVPIGEKPTPEQLAALGVTGNWDPGEVVNENLVVLNDPANMAVGVPGGGGIGTAADLALFYQGLLHNPGGLWDAGVLRAGTAEVWCDFDEPLMRIPALRTLGLAMAGDDGNAAMRGFGHTVTAAAFGHMGAGLCIVMFG